MNERDLSQDVPGPDGAVTPVKPPQVADSDVPAWEMVQPGRYMPRRIRGSYLGRELG